MIAVADDYDTIGKRVAEIAKDERPRCPQNFSRLLHECLRSAAQCEQPCPLRDDWIGPQP